MKAKSTNGVVHLLICHNCHKRITNGKTFTRYQDSLHCTRCFINNLEKFNLADFNSSEILIDGEVYNAISEPLVEEEFDPDAISN
jgi:hypothetical protein